MKTEDKENISRDDKNVWYMVGFIKGTSVDVQHYYSTEDDSEDQVFSLEPGTAYKFRVAAVNSVGRSEWSEVFEFSLYVSASSNNCL